MNTYQCTKDDAWRIRTLAIAFSKRLWVVIGSAELSEVVRLNSKESNPSICHSHDFCDANQVMLDAWESVFGDEHDCQSDDQNVTWVKAWNLAKSLNFQTN